MSRVVVHRPPRRPPPAVPTGEVPVAAPPQPVPAGGVAWWTYLFPVLGSAGALLFVVINPQPVYLAAGGLFLAGSLAMAVGMYGQQRSGQRRRLHREREAYLAYLRRLRAAARETERRQRLAASWQAPASDRLWTVARSPAACGSGGSGTTTC